jgi:hypothetical protein
VHAPPAAVSAFKLEEDEELIDILCLIYDQLKLAKALVDSRNSSFALLFAEPEGLTLEAPLAVCFPQAFVLALSYPCVAPQDKLWPRTPNPRIGL